MLIEILLYLGAFSLLEYLYLKIAFEKKIFDKVTERSSHTSEAIRGAGIIFVFAFIAPFFITNIFVNNMLVLTGILIISIISFVDDIKSVKVHLRMVVHLTAVSLMLCQISVYPINIYLILLELLFIVGVINAYNFMDGINGITAIYSLTAVCTLYYINQKIITIINPSVFLSLISALLVFSFLNVRKKAICFSGDVGSISMAFILAYLVLKLIIESGNYIWILLLAVYGIDSLTTIIIRIIRKERIFEAHRSHFYQYLANERKLSHILISTIYGVVQLGLNIVLITQKPVFSISIFVIITLLYFVIRLLMERKNLFITKA